MSLFNRIASVVIGKRGETGISIRDVRIVFDVTKNSDKNPNTCSVQIYNLSKATRNLIKEDDDTLIYVYAGYKNSEGESLVYSGDITFVNHSINPPDIITTIESQDGAKVIKDSVFSKSYGAGISAEVIMNDILKTINLPKKLRGTIINKVKFANSFAFSGSSMVALKKILDSLSLEYSIQNNELKIINKNKSDGTQAIVINENTGLVNSPEKISDSLKEAKGETTEKRSGWRIVSLLNPKIEPAGSVAISSEEIPENSIYKVDRVTHTGDTHGSDWFSKIEVFE